MKFLLTQRCTACHRLDGQGAENGTDLGGKVARDYSPASLVSAIWNHGSGASPQFDRPGAGRPRFTEPDIRNLFAYALSRRYFEKPGDASRGRQVFAAKGCAGCHGISTVQAPGGLPVAAWTSLSDPVALAAEMWNHAPKMITAKRRSRSGSLQLTSQELTDLLLYLRTLPEIRGKQIQFSSLAGDAGRRLSETKRCSGCHPAGWRLRRAVVRLTATEFATSMWNHRLGPATKASALDRQEMRAIFNYLWSAGMFEEPASPNRGRRLFSKKRCASCHGGENGQPGAPEAPRLRFGELDPVSAATALLNHGPGMLDSARREHIEWPRLAPGQMRDLMAFLSAKGAR